MRDGGNGSRLSDQLLEQALLDVEDLMERSLTSYIVVGEVAKCMVEKKLLDANKVEVVVKPHGMIEEARRTIKTFFFEGDGLVEDDKGMHYTKNGVPVYIHLLKRKYKFFKNPDRVVYNYADYLIPNPFDLYWKSRHFVR